MNKKLSGNLIIIGGAEDKEGRKEILKKVTSLEEPKDNPGDFDQLSLELRT